MLLMQPIWPSFFPLCRDFSVYGCGWFMCDHRSTNSRAMLVYIFTWVEAIVKEQKMERTRAKEGERSSERNAMWDTVIWCVCWQKSEQMQRVRNTRVGKMSESTHTPLLWSKYIPLYYILKHHTQKWIQRLRTANSQLAPSFFHSKLRVYSSVSLVRIEWLLKCWTLAKSESKLGICSKAQKFSFRWSDLWNSI